MSRVECHGGGVARFRDRAIAACSLRQIWSPIQSAAADREVLRPRASGGEGGRRPDEGALIGAQCHAPHPHSASLRVSLSPLSRGEGCSRSNSGPGLPSTTFGRRPFLDQGDALNRKGSTAVEPDRSIHQGLQALNREVLRPRPSGGEGGRRPDEGALIGAQCHAPHPHSASLRVSLAPLSRGEGCSVGRIGEEIENPHRDFQSDRSLLTVQGTHHAAC